MNTYFTLAQAVGLCAMGFDVYATTHKSDGRLKLFYCLGCFTYALHFFMLGAATGVIAELFNGARVGLSYLTRSKYLAFFFLAAYGVMIFIVPETFIDTLPFLSSLSITTGLYFYEDIKLRIFYLIGFLFWLIYSIAVFSIGGTISYIVLLVLTSITIFRLVRNKRKACETNL